MLFASGWTESNQQDIYDSATLMFNSQEYELAIDEYQALVDAGAKGELGGKALFYLAECQFRLKIYKQSMETFKTFLVSHSKHALRASAQYRFAEALYLSQQYQKAAGAYRRFIKEQPNHELVPKALFSGAGALMEIGQGKEAQAMLKELNDRFPKHPKASESRYFIAWTHFKNKDYNKAGEAFLTFAKSSPSSPKAIESLLRAADAFYSLESFERSLTLYNKVLADGQGAFKKECHIGIAWSYYKLTQFEKAGNFFGKLARESDQLSDREEYFYQSLRAYFDGEKFRLGLATANEMLKSSDKTKAKGDALYWIGTFHQKLSAPEKAADFLEQASKSRLQRISLGTVLLALGNLRQELNTPEDALKAYQLALKGNLDEEVKAQIRYESSRVLHVLGRTDEALKMVKENLEGSGQTKGLKALSEFSTAEFKYAKKDYRGAIAHYLKVLEGGDPKLHDDALYRLAWSHKHLEELKDAILRFQQLQTKSEDYRQESLYLLGELYRSEGQEKEAEKAYRAAISMKGSHSDHASLSLAQYYHDLEKLTQAKGVLIGFRQSFPKSTLLNRAEFLLAEIHYGLKEREAALKQYSRVLTNPASGITENAYYGRAWLYFEMKKFEDSLKDLEALLKTFPESKFKSSALQLKGQIFMQTNRLDMAKAVLSKGLEGSGAEGEEALLMKLANVESELGNKEKALDYYNLLLARYPKSELRSRVTFEKGWLYMETKKSNDALLMFRAYQNNWPKGEAIEDVNFALGQLAYEKELYADAIKSYQLCAGSERYMDKALYKIGFSHYRIKDYEKAALAFSQLTQQAPESNLALEAKYREGQSWLKAEKFKEAAKALPRFMGIGKNDPLYKEALYDLAKVQEKLGNRDLAINSYEDFIKIYKDDDKIQEASFSLGNLLLEKGSFPQAREYLKSILNDPTHFLAIESQFLMGESYFREERYRDAVRAYFQIQKYKDAGTWQAKSWVKIALCQLAMKRKDKAKTYLKKVMDGFPGSQQANEAIEILKDIEKS
jgi:cellulose synthase operon protein C